MSRPSRFLVVVGCALIVLGGAGVEAQIRKGKGLRPQAKGCLDCHQREAGAYKARASRHEPASKGQCESCHMRHGVVGVLRLSAEDPDLCLTCHPMEGRTAAAGKPPRAPAGVTGKTHLFTHPPGATLRCLTCHDPHGSDAPRLVKQAGRASCLSCHDPAAFEGASRHAPGAADCLTCHDPHGSRLPGSLAREPERLCASCHDGSSAAEGDGHGGMNPTAASCLGCHAPHASAGGGLMRPFVHAPLAEGGSACATCHTDAGEGGGAPGLAAPVGDLCLGCHQDPRAVPAGSTGGHVHAPVAAGDCLLCHVPHAAARRGLLKRPQADLCGACHTQAKEALEAEAPHPPAREECSACHFPHAGPADLLRASAPALCTTCHADVKGQTARAAPHPPAAEGACLACHDPHGSAHAGILKEAPAALCGTCHESTGRELQGRVVHPPARDGACTACHEPHGSDGARLLKPNLTAACLACHKRTAASLPAGGRHAPFEAGDCLTCHRPHASSREGLLAMEPGRLCRSCHESLEGEAGAEDVHAPVSRGQCLSCHGPHGGHPPALLRSGDPRTMCLSCHADQGRLLVRQEVHLHAPFRTDSCLTCHSAHASSQEGLLAKAPASLCATCHDPTKPALTAPHRGLLGPGTDCAACHEPHAGRTPKLLLADQHAPFGAGDCGACHQGASR